VTSFSEGRESVNDKGRSGRPAMSKTKENIAEVRQIVHENHQQVSGAQQGKRTSTEKQGNLN
jgi:hypothetical protein